MQLCDKPVPPEDTIKLRPKRYGDQLVNFDEIPEWVSYWYDVFFDCLFQCAHLGFVHPIAESSCADTKIIPCRLPFIHKNAVFGVIFVRERNVTALIMKVDRHISGMFITCILF